MVKAKYKIMCRHQITVRKSGIILLPSHIIKRLGIKDGDIVYLLLKGGKVIISKKPYQDSYPRFVRMRKIGYVVSLPKEIKDLNIRKVYHVEIKNNELILC